MENVETRQTRRHLPSGLANTCHTCILAILAILVILAKCPEVILAKMYTFAKPLFEKNDIRLSKFAQVLRESGECCSSSHCLYLCQNSNFGRRKLMLKFKFWPKDIHLEIQIIITEY